MQEQSTRIQPDLENLKNLNGDPRPNRLHGRMFSRPFVEVIARVGAGGKIRELTIDDSDNLSIESEDWVGTNLQDLLPADLAEIGMNHLQANLLNGQSHCFEYRIADGENERIFEIKMAAAGQDEVLFVVRDITGNSSAENHLSRLNRAFLALQLASTTVNASVELDQVTESLAKELTNLLNAGSCSVSEWNTEDDSLLSLAVHPPLTKQGIVARQKTYLESFTPVVQRILQERYASRIESAELGQNFLGASGSGIRLLLPMVYNNQSIGLVQIVGKNEQQFQEEDVALAQFLTNVGATAIVNARFHLESQRHLRAQTALQRAISVISSSLDLQTVLDYIAEQLNWALDLTSTYICIVDPVTGVSKVAAEYLSANANELERISDLGVEYDENSGLMATSPSILFSGRSKVWYVDDEDMLPRERDHMLAFGGITALGVPLNIAGKVVAYAELWDSRLKRVFTQEEIDLAESIAQQAASALTNAQLYKQAHDEIRERKKIEVRLKNEQASLAERVEMRTIELKRQYRRQRMVASIEPAISHPSKLDNVFQQIVLAAEEGLPADGGAALIFWDKDPRELEVWAASSRLPEGATNGSVWQNGGITEQVIESIRSLILQDPRATSYPVSNWLREVGIRSCIGSPLLTRGEAGGALFALNFKTRSYSREELDFLVALANRAAVAIGNVELYDVLQHTNEELAHVSNMKDEFLAGMSHELRTPLNAILGITEVLMEGINGPISSQQQKSLKIVEESGLHLLDLINDILDVSKLQAGQLDLVLRPMVVRAICESSMKFVRQSAVKKHITITFTIDEQVNAIVADPRRLKQILINLLSNAVKFTPEHGSIGLEVKGHPSQEMVHLSVWDTGIGIAEEDLPNLFQPFTQLDSKLSRRYGGSGLGLVIVKRLVEMHGGALTVQSKPGEGSRFTLALPWNAAESIDTRKDITITLSVAHLLPADAFTTERQDGDAKPVILLVDDDKLNTQIYYDFLRMKGCNPIVVYSGREAVEQNLLAKPDLILMDIQMPDMDGFEAIRLIRSQSERSNVPIIALTALAMPEDRERCLQAGADEYISKPVPLRNLARTIQTCLDNSQLLPDKESL